MTVTANTTRNDYTAGSAQSVYNYTFQLNEAADVDVYLNGVKQTLNTHYTVQNVDNASGGTITFTLVDASNNPIHPTQGAVINIVMAMDLDRDTNYQPSGAFLAADVNNDFDRLWHASNQQQTAINRSLRLQDTDVTTSTMELPLKDARKGKLLGFNASTGDPEATTNNQSNWDTAYNDRITSASFSGSTLTLGQQDGGTITASHTPYLPIAGGTLTGDLAFGVNKAVFPSLEIYGAIGDHSIIEETGSGNLIIKGTDVRIQSADNEDVIKGVANGAVTLYYDNAPKLATTNTGISITGTLSATGYNSSNWDTAYNDKINAVNYSNNTLTLTQQDGSTLTTTINGGGGGGGTATGVDLADNVIATFGDDNDLQIYHNGSHSYIDEVGTGSLYIRANDFRLSNADGSQNHIIANNNGEVSLRYSGSPKLDTTSTGIDVTGDVSLPDNGKATFGASDDLQIYHDGSNSYVTDAGTGGLYLRGSNEIALRSSSNENIFLGLTDGSAYVYHNGSVKLQTTSTGIDVTGNVSLPDNGKAKFGAGDDLQIYHDGSNSYVKDVGTGYLILGNSDAGTIIKNGSGQNLLTTTASEIRLGHQGDTKLATTATGIDVTGSVTADGIVHTGDTDTFIKFIDNRIYAERGGVRVLDFETNSSKINSYDSVFIQTGTTTKNRIKVNQGGDISFYEDTGTTPSLLWDSSATALTITGRESSRSSNTYAFEVDNSAQTSNLSASGSFRVKGNTGDSLVVTGQGNVGIGTTSPSHKLDISGGHLRLDDAYRIRFGGGTAAIEGNGSSNILSLITNNAERMRIDSSGNVLVGKTVTGTANGVQIEPAGAISLNRDGSTPLFLNRKTSDGTIADFRKDGTTVGSIGVVSGSNFYINNGDTGLGFRPSADDIVPVSSGGSGRDNAIDIGDPLFRFKDLYLSAGAYASFIAGHNDTNTSINFAGSDVITFNNGGSEAARIDSSGNVGIGTTSPDHLLDVAGASGTISSIKVANPDVGLRMSAYTNSHGEIRVETNHPLVFKTNGNNERMRIDSSGNVGIGTTSPSQELHIASSGEADIRLQGSSSANHLDIFHNASDFGLWGTGTQQLKLATNNSEAMRIDSSGKVGIGTSSPSADLHIYKGSSGVTPASDSGLFIEGQYSCSLQLATYWAGVTNINFGVGPSSGAQDPNNGQIYYSNYSKVMGFKVNGSERARINFYGQLLVGTTGSQDTTSKLLVSGTSAATTFKTSSAGSIFYGAGNQGSAGLDIRSYTTTTSFAQNLMRFSNSSNSTGGSITITGATVSYNTSSDERLKENIKDAEDAGDKIDAIKIRQFDWKEGGEHQDYGVIAQELDEVAPEAVTKGATEDDMMSVDYSKLVPTLIKEIQSLRNRVAELEKN